MNLDELKNRLREPSVDPADVALLAGLLELVTFLGAPEFPDMSAAAFAADRFDLLTQDAVGQWFVIATSAGRVPVQAKRDIVVKGPKAFIGRPLDSFKVQNS